MRPFRATLTVRAATAFLLLGVMFQLAPASERLPNLVLILTDDLGYTDLGVYGAKGFATPNIDRLAREGMRFTDFHVAQAVCSASHAALLTGCYPNRIGIEGAMEPWYDFGKARPPARGWLSMSRTPRLPANRLFLQL